MRAYYPNLVESCIEFKIHSRTLIAKHSKKKYVPTAEDQTTELAKGFKVEKDPNSGFIYCLRLDQTIAQRKIEKAKLPAKPTFDATGKAILEDESVEI